MATGQIYWKPTLKIKSRNIQVLILINLHLGTCLNFFFFFHHFIEKNVNVCVKLLL